MYYHNSQQRCLESSMSQPLREMVNLVYGYRHKISVAELNISHHGYALGTGEYRLKRRKR